MTTTQLPGSIGWPSLVTQYASADAGPLQLGDTESLFNLDGVAQYTLPGLLYDYRTTPSTRLLMENAASPGGQAIIGPPDFNQLPTPSLADFRGIGFQSLNDFARVYWAGTLWTILETGGPSVVVMTASQSPQVPA